MDTTDFFAHIFRNIETDTTWSINDLWLQIQGVTDPFAGLGKGCTPVVRTACFPYLGNVVANTPSGEIQLGDVLLSIGLWLEVEQVDFESARKVEYKALSGETLQRVEFASAQSGLKDWRISLQMPRDSTDLGQLRTGSNWPIRKD